MALGDGNDLGAGGDEMCTVGVGGDGVDGEVFLRYDFIEPLGAGIDEVYFAGEGGKDGDKRLDDVAGAEDGDVPCGRGAVEFEEECHFPAAGHSDVALEVPGLEVGGGGVLGGKDCGRMGEGAGFDFASANGSGVEAFICNDEFLAGNGGGAAA